MRTLTEIKVFIAAPGDVEEERGIIRSVADQINAEGSVGDGIIIKIVGFDSDVYPDIGNDAQDVINKQIRDDYDIFVGVLWCRYGTPTPRADSGTEEEFLRAIKKREEGNDSVPILIYFKEKEVSPHDVDLEQLKKVRDFRSRIGAMGIYNNFSQSSDFAMVIRLDLIRSIRSILNNSDAGRVPIDAIEGDPSPDDSNLLSGDELGLFDYSEIFYEKSDEVVDYTNRITQILTNLSERIGERTSELNEMRVKGLNDSRKLRRINSAASLNLEASAAEIEILFAPMSDGLTEMINAMANIVTIGEQDGFVSDEQKKKYKSAIKGLVDNIQLSIDSMKIFVSTIEQLPRTSLDFNKSKSRLSSVVNRIIDVFETARNSMISLV